MNYQQDILTTEQLIDLLRYKPYILDIRTSAKYCSGHLCGSIHIDTPLPLLTNNALTQLKQKLSALSIKGYNTPIIVYCKKANVPQYQTFI